MELHENRNSCFSQWESTNIKKYIFTTKMQVQSLNSPYPSVIENLMWSISEKCITHLRACFTALKIIETCFFDVANGMTN